MADLSLAEISEVLKYDPDTGSFEWKPRPREMFRSLHEFVRWNNRYAGKPTGNKHYSGYVHLIFLGRRFAAHRVAWLFLYGQWPEGEIDHVNGIRSDNRGTNLRDVDRSGNQRNASRRTDNTSGVVGVVWSKRASKWASRINIYGQRKNLGFFDQLEDAVAARKAAEREYGFHENHGRAA